jgi:hypothetical protein
MDLQGQMNKHNVTHSAAVIKKCGEQDAAIVLTVCQRARDGAMFCQYPDGVTIPTDKLVEILQASIVQIQAGGGVKITPGK